MEALLMAVLVALFVPVTHLSPANLADFERLPGKVGTEVYVVDALGLERVGRLIGADGSGLRLAVPAGELQLSRADIAEVDRRRDSVLDGTIKGLIFGALVGGLASGGRGSMWWSATAIYGGIGFALDSAVRAREPLYRAPPPSGATGKSR